jgi:hypothetical protein
MWQPALHLATQGSLFPWPQNLKKDMLLAVKMPLAEEQLVRGQ